MNNKTLNFAVSSCCFAEDGSSFQFMDIHYILPKCLVNILVPTIEGNKYHVTGNAPKSHDFEWDTF